MSQVVRRSATILRSLSNHPEGRTVAEIAAAVDLPRSSVHRLLRALVDEHLVAAVSNGVGFRLGPALMQLSSSSSSWLVQTLHPFLVELSSDLDETVDLSVQSGNRVYFVDQVAGRNRLQAISETGVAFPAFCTANGKALLAQLADEEVLHLLGEQPEASTPNTIVNPDAFLVEIAEIRKTGIAFDNEEHQLGISAVGAALINPQGLAAALSVPVPTTRFVDRKDEIVSHVHMTKKRIERHLRELG